MAEIASPRILGRQVKKAGKKPFLRGEEHHSSTEEERGDDEREPVAMVSLSGVGITNTGEVTKRDFFTFLKGHITPENDRILPREQAVRLQKYMLALSTGSATVAPLICAAERCPMNHICPFGEFEGGYPVTRPCPIETELMAFKKMQYIEELKVNINSPSEMSLINELVEIEIYEIRISAQLAKERDGSLVSLETLAHDREGEPVMARQVSPFWEAKERLTNRKSRILKLLVADRQEQYKKDAALGRRENDDDPSSNWADMRARLKKIQDTQVVDTTCRPVSPPSNKDDKMS